MDWGLATIQSMKVAARHCKAPSSVQASTASYHVLVLVLVLKFIREEEGGERSMMQEARCRCQDVRIWGWAK